jgi:cytosine/adenosine deaminase-related metal-dependent hydrolase
MIKMQKCHIVSHWPSLTCVTKCQTANRRSSDIWGQLRSHGRSWKTWKTWKMWKNMEKPKYAQAKSWQFMAVHGHGTMAPWPGPSDGSVAVSWCVDVSCVMRWTIWTYMNRHHQPWAVAMKPSWSLHALHAFCVIFSSFFIFSPLSSLVPIPVKVIKV